MVGFFCLHLSRLLELSHLPPQFEAQANYQLLAFT